MPDKQSAVAQKSGPLPAGLPHVAYVLLWYPLFTQPFIFSEVENLRTRLPLQTYTLYGRNIRHCSEKMRNTAMETTSFGIAALLPLSKNLLLALLKSPLKIIRLFRKTCLKRWPSWEILGENFWAFCVGVTLGKKFKEDGIDFVYAPWPRGAATAAWVGASLANLPFALAARGDNLNPADPDLGDKLDASCFIRANNAADQARIENFGENQAKDKTVLVYNSLTLKPGKVSDNPERLAKKPVRLLAVGRFDVTKGFDILLHACALLKKRGMPFRLTLAGGGGKMLGLGKLEKELKTLRRELDLEAEVDMPGLISHDELPKILGENDIFVAPCIIHASGKRDGIPNTVIEALAFGMPVIATNVNALPEVVKNGETGLCVEPGNAEALADAIIWMADNPEHARQMGQNGAILSAKMFDPELNAQKLVKAFKDGQNKWLAGLKQSCVA